MPANKKGKGNVSQVKDQSLGTEANGKKESLAEVVISFCVLVVQNHCSQKARSVADMKKKTLDQLSKDCVMCL